MEIPESLIKKISSKNIVLFVGAGLSMESGFPSWSALVKNILEDIGDKEPKGKKLIEALFDDILTPLELLKKIEHLKEYAIEALDKELRAFSQLQPTETHKLLNLLSDKIVTTNYDHLIERSNKEYEKIVYTNDYKVAKLGGYQRYIFKIHGDMEQPDKCVLFPSEYENLYSQVETSAVFQLKKIISDKSILFLGFSYSDPYIKYVFDYIEDLSSGFSPEHFIVTTERHREWPRRFTPIIIEKHTELLSTLNKIIEQKNKTIENEVVAFQEFENRSSEIFELSGNLEYDLPPRNKTWVGRSKELLNITNDNFKVIFITGIGGQGKSALAAQYLKSHFDSKVYEFGDWRDFKEEINRFQTKLISIIERLTKGEIGARQLDRLDTKALVDTFYHYLNDRKIIFVFDNIDSYIDLETFRPTGIFEYFFNQAMSGIHNSKFIFTCRPFIREASINFYQISLSGLSTEETEELFNQYDSTIKKSLLKELSFKAHKLTRGHPLWLNLIAGQAVRGIDVVNLFISKIEDKSNFDENDFSAILSEKILTEVWNTLNDKQRDLIRGIAETVKPETENNLKVILAGELNLNQFNKAIRALRNLNLVEIKSSSISEDQIELHPLVKEFVLNKYQKIERAKFITLFVQYYDAFIFILKPKLSSLLTMKEFQNWTSKIELQINKGDFKLALAALAEVYQPLLSAGYVEEYLRITEKLYNNVDWSQAMDSEFPYFHSQFSTLTSSLSQFGRYEVCYLYLKKYSELIRIPSAKCIWFRRVRINNFVL